jgi:hypothetical protein
MLPPRGRLRHGTTYSAMQMLPFAPRIDSAKLDPMQ